MTAERTRLVAPADPSPEAVAVLESGWQFEGAPLNAPRLMAHHPRLLKRFAVFAGLFLDKSLLPPRDRELLTLRSTVRANSEYYFGHHVRVAETNGISPDDIRNVVDLDHVWSGRDATLISVADELVLGGVVSDQTWSELRTIYDDAQVLEAVFLPGFYRMVAGVVSSIGAESEPGLPGFP
jgi:4-carboxymuconolactone decarboxylase